MASSRNYGGDWKRRRLVVLARDGHVCAYCGRYAGTVDHVTPLADHGTDDLANLVACCSACNSRRSMEHANARRRMARAYGWVAARGATRPSYLRSVRGAGPTGALTDSGHTGDGTPDETTHTPTGPPVR